MSNTLRIVLLLSALITAVWILRKIYKCKVKLEDAIYWFCMAIILGILGVIPEIAYWCADVIGIQTPVNFIFLFILALVIEKLLSLSIKVSQLEDKITSLAAELAIRSYDAEEQIENIKKKEEKNLEING